MYVEAVKHQQVTINALWLTGAATIQTGKRVNRFFFQEKVAGKTQVNIVLGIFAFLQLYQQN